MSQHACETHTEWQACGPAITSCEEDEWGRLWASNDEYSSQVSWCPFCGYKAQSPAARLVRCEECYEWIPEGEQHDCPCGEP